MATERMNEKRKVLGIGRIGFLCVFLLAAFGNPAFGQEGRRLDRMSICIEKSAHSLVITGISVHFFDDEMGELLGQAEGENRHRVRVAGNGIEVDGRVYEISRLRLKSPRNWLKVGKRVFREDLIVLRLPDRSDRLALVNEVLLESYLYGLINKESLSRWPLEEKMAQAVAARTYALHKKIDHPKDLCDLDSTVLDQMYGGYGAEDQEARRAVDATRGEVLTYNSRVAKTYYHANSGGRTARAADVWGRIPAVFAEREGSLQRGHAVVFMDAFPEKNRNLAVSWTFLPPSEIVSPSISSNAMFQAG